MQEQIKNTFEKELIHNGYQNLFLTNSEDNYESVWKDGKNEEKLNSIVSSENSSFLGRFLASEILLRKDIEIDKKYEAILSESYAYALKMSDIQDEKFIGIYGNSWGFLTNEKDVGILGKRFFRYGKTALPSLVKLLDENGKPFYQGSQEAMLGNAYQYRIKDFAAFYISIIKEIPITFYEDFDKRDAEIERLKKILEKE